MATPFLPYDGSKAKFVLQFKDNGGGAVQIIPLRPVAGVALPTFTRAGATATTVLANGLVSSVIAANTARSYYDPTSLAYLGYLAEGARTNLCLQSEALTSATWTKLRSSAAGSSTAPDGALSAVTITEDATAGNTHEVSQSITIVGATTYAASVFVKAGTRTAAQLRFGDTGGNNGVLVNINLSTGALSGAATVGAGWTLVGTQTQTFPNGWFRVTVIGTSAAATNGHFVVYLANPLGTIVYDGDGASGALVWGAVLEAGSFSSTYIPTTTASVTRNADVLTYPLTGWFNAAAGTLYGQGTWLGVQAITQVLWGLNNNATTDYINLERFSGNIFGGIVTGSVTQASVASTAVGAGSSAKMAMAYAANDAAASVNGGAVGTDATVTLPTVAIAGIGNTNAVNTMFGTISSIGYWSERLSNNDLLYITTNDVDFTVFTPAPSGGSSQTNIPAAFHARGQSDEQKRRSRVKFGLEKEVEKVIERVAENQVQRQERDAQKRFEQLTRELEISGIEYQARYLELLNIQRERLIEARAEEVKKEIQAQADIESLVQSGQQAVDEHYSKIAQQLEQFAADSAQVNQQFIQMLQTFDHEYRAELLRYVPADLLRRRR